MSDRRVVGTIGHVFHVGRALEVPTETAVSEVRVIIEGKLRELGREPNNVQVLISTSRMSLLDKGEELMSIPVESE